MDLYSGMPYWLIKNPMDDYFNPLQRDIDTRVLVIGSGITGSLVANELCRRGIECAVIDKRSVSTGSSVASTALLQYEIDVPLSRLIEKTGEKDAVEAYRSCLRSIDDLEQVLREAELDADFQRVPSVYYASRRRDRQMLEQEYTVRAKHGLPVEFMDKKQLRSVYGIDKAAALRNHASAQIDAYKASTGLLSYNMASRGLKIFTHTEVTEWEKEGDQYILQTSREHTIRARYVVVATGFEAGPFLPGKPMELTTTFAVISEPVPEEYLWQDRSLIWETAQPYLYIRTNGSNRIIVGGEDEKYNSILARRFQIDGKSRKLETKFHKLMPTVPFKTEMAWCGTFSSTKDGLPIIGPAPEDDNILYALGYGGNGITFSMIAAQVIAARVSGEKDPREEVFAITRKSLV